MNAMTTEGSTRAAGIEYQRLTGTLGAEVRGVDMTQPIDATTIAELTAGLVKYKVLFFRAQAITTQQHLDFALRFGKSEPYALGELGSLTFHPEYRDIAVLDSVPGKAPSRADVWHSDLTFQVMPSFGSILRRGKRHCCSEPSSIGFWVCPRTTR